MTNRHFLRSINWLKLFAFLFLCGWAVLLVNIVGHIVGASAFGYFGLYLIAASAMVAAATAMAGGYDEH